MVSYGSAGKQDITPVVVSSTKDSRMCSEQKGLRVAS